MTYHTTCQWKKEAPSCDWGFFHLGDKDDDDDDDADEKMQSSGIPNGGHIRQESQEQSEVDHGDFEMVVSLWQQERGGGAPELSSRSYSVYFIRYHLARDTDRAFSLQSESMVLETAENVNNGNPSPLEALLAGAEGFPPMLDIPPDADDETMVELAIALSLQQDQQGRRQCQEQSSPLALQKKEGLAVTDIQLIKLIPRFGERLIWVRAVQRYRWRVRECGISAWEPVS